MLKTVVTIGGGGGNGVTQINTGTGLTGGPITTTGTISTANIPNSSLSNSSVTIGNTAVSLGSTATSVGNLTLTNVIISSFSSSPSSAAWIVNSNNVNVQTNTSYTLVSSDNGKVVTCNNSSAITVTVPANLGAGFSCLLVQLGTGNVKPTANSTTINANGGKSNTNGQYSVVSLYAYAADTFLMSGNMQ